jgi:hypothetical protein
MFTFLFRTIWRVVVLALAVALTYLTVFVLFPYLDDRVPVAIAAFVLYCFVAYFGIPTLIRFWRLVIKPNHIPLYATTPDGWASDPVNIAVAAKSKRHLIKAMKQAGWYKADKHNFLNTLREVYAIALNKPYPTAPFSKLYLFGRNFDIGFQISYGINGSPRKRHHVRFWQLGAKIQDTHKHEAFWLKLLKRFLGQEKTVWIGAAVDDIDIKGIRWRNLQLNHSTHAEHYRERDYIIDTLKKEALVKTVHTVKAGEPFTMRSQNFGSEFIVDGTLRVVELKSPTLAKVEKTLQLN